MKELALSLQLTMGLLIGSVSAIIQTVELLAQHELVLNSQVLALVEQCAQLPADFDISYPNVKVNNSHCCLYCLQLISFTLESSR